MAVLFAMLTSLLWVREHLNSPKGQYGVGKV